MAKRYGATNNTAGELPGHTASQFKRMSKANRVEAMVEWFHMNYEDPANRLPYQTAEGGYQWIWGGPYDAIEELEQEFGDVVDFELIEEAASQIQDENGIYDWAPIEKHGDRDDEPPPDGEIALEDLGLVPEETLSEVRAREEMLERLDALEKTISPILDHIRRQDEPGIGHNNPPPEFEIGEALTKEDWQKLQDQIDTLRAEAGKPSPSAEVAQESRLVFISSLMALGRWLGNRINAAIDNTTGIAIGIAVSHQAVFDALEAATEAIKPWLDAISLPF